MTTRSTAAKLRRGYFSSAVILVHPFLLFLSLIPCGFATGSAPPLLCPMGIPFNRTVGESVFIPPLSSSICFALLAISVVTAPADSSISSSSSSLSLLSSANAVLKTKFLAIRYIKYSQNRLTACRHARRANVMYWLIQHLYCCVSQLSS